MEGMTRQEKLRATMIAKHGSLEAYQEEMRKRGAQSNRQTPRGFAKMDTDKVKELSRRGIDARQRKAQEKKNAKGEDR